MQELNFLVNPVQRESNGQRSSVLQRSNLGEREGVGFGHLLSDSQVRCSRLGLLLGSGW